MLKNMLKMDLKLLQNEQFKNGKTSEVTGDLIGNKITNKITQNSPINEQNSQTEQKAIFRLFN